MVYLYNESLFLFGRVKNAVKALLGRRTRGPEAVRQSLFTGFKELGVEFSFNARVNRPIEVACVLSGVKTLRWAIGLKKKGLIKKIIAGPNIAVSPKEENGLLEHSSIDKVVVPSCWIRDFYLTLSPSLAEKIQVWPAGVTVPPKTAKKKKYDFLVYNKIGENILFLDIREFLKGNDANFKIITYGKFNQKEYFELLDESKYEIYLSESESQGLAMFEAWARDVPTLVWERGFWQKGANSWNGFTTSEYLTKQEGLRFKDFKEFKVLFLKLSREKFSPREYISKNFTNRIGAKNYLTVINN